MPGAPVSTQTRTASMTDGITPPRELRSVATLLTLTDRFAMEIRMQNSECRIQNAEFPLRRRSDVHLDGVDDLLAPAADFLDVLALEHDAQQWLGPGVAHEQSSVAFQA